MALDLAKYVAPECQNQATQFALVGFVVHRETLKGGHDVPPIK
jgi:hypothetical protein